MKRFPCAVAVITFLAAFTVGRAWTQEIADPPAADAVVMDDGSELWFVELSSPPTADGTDLATVLNEQAGFRSSAAQAGVQYAERKAFHSLWNGLTVAIQPGELSKLRRVPGVGAMYPVIKIEMDPVTPVNDADLLTALSMTGADVAQSSLGLTGAGIRVGVIDTGIDYDHADLGGDGTQRTNSNVFPTGRVVVGHDFVGDLFNTTGIPVPDPYPDDCNGHGSHVSGIVGASGAVTGVAPGVTLGAYRVFGCSGSTTADIMIDAMERALADGMHVVNMSIGNAFQFPSYPTAAAATRLVNAGVVVACSMGNNGTSGLYAGSAPGVGRKVISVAAFENTHINLAAFSITPDNMTIAYNAGINAPPPPLSGMFPMARTGTSTSTADACMPLLAGSLTGKVALIRRGTCSFYQKATNARNAGAVGVVLYNNVAGSITPVLTPPVMQPLIDIPVVGITATQGVLINNRLALGPVSMTWTQSSAPNATAGRISAFSSYGVSPDLTLKPDIGAPGGFILSTLPLESGGYGNISGTSMSSPHVAGCAALLLEARPNTPPAAVQTILMNNASPQPRAGAPAGLDNVHRQGAGMVDIAAAVLSTAKVEPAKLELGEGGGWSRMLTLENKGPSTVTWTLSHEPALSTGPNTFLVSQLAAGAAVGFNPGSITVPPNGIASVEVTITPDAGLPDKSLLGGYIKLSPDDGGGDLRVPYSGFKGDYQSYAILTAGFPLLARLVGNSFIPQPGGATYTMQGNDVPFFLVHLDHSVSLLEMSVSDANTGQAWHRFLREKDFRRSTTANSFFAFGWGGATFHGNTVEIVPNGQYRVTISVLKALGDPNNPAHNESWTSPVVTVARPALAVSRFLVSQSSVQPGDQVLVRATVRNSGPTGVQGVVVDFLDNDEPLGSVTVDLDSGESEDIELPWTVGEAATHVLEARVDPNGVFSEESVADNVAELTINLGEVIVGVGGKVPDRVALAPAAPNPFGRNVAFRFGLPREGEAAFEVFDMLGRRLRSWSWKTLPAGEHTLSWDGRTEEGRDVPAGLLVYRLTALGRTLTQKAVRLP